MSDDESQRQNRGHEHEQEERPREDVGVGNAGVPHRHRHRRRRRRARARAPSPLWVRRGDGRMERVKRTPLVVLDHDLDDPFLLDDDEVDAVDGDDGDGDESSYYDSCESDDENNVVTLPEAVEPGRAQELLSELVVLDDKYWRYRLRELAVDFGADVVSDWDDYPNSIRKLVQVLGAYGGIKTLDVARGNFGRDPDDLESADESDDEIGVDLSRRVEGDCLDSFFGSVLCGHDSLREITFFNCRIPIKYWRLFTENFLTAHSSLEFFCLESTRLNMEKCQLLKRMLQHENGLIWLSLDDCGLGADEWQVVCEGFADSGGPIGAVTLMEDGVTVGPDTLLPLIRLPSAVDYLHVRALAWSDGAFEELVQGLRTNECLRELTLQINQGGFARLDLVEEMLTTYNCTLKELTLLPLDAASQGRINALLERNQRVRMVKEQLTEYNRSKKKLALHPVQDATQGDTGKPDKPTAFERYHLPQKSAWPLVLAECARLPTQLYRFLRIGNLEGFAGQAEEAAAAEAALAPARTGNKNKRRRRLRSG